MDLNFWLIGGAIVSIIGGLSALVALVSKIPAQIAGERKLRSLVYDPQHDELPWSQGTVPPSEKSAERIETLRFQFVQQAMVHLKGLERDAVLEALNQPSRLGRERYVQKLLRSAGGSGAYHLHGSVN
jgi:hypothetical protein